MYDKAGGLFTIWTQTAVSPSIIAIMVEQFSSPKNNNQSASRPNIFNYLHI